MSPIKCSNYAYLVMISVGMVVSACSAKVDGGPLPVLAGPGPSDSQPTPTPGDPEKGKVLEALQGKWGFTCINRFSQAFTVKGSEIKSSASMYNDAECKEVAFTQEKVGNLSIGNAVGTEGAREIDFTWATDQDGVTQLEYNIFKVTGDELLMGLQAGDTPETRPDKLSETYRFQKVVN